MLYELKDTSRAEALFAGMEDTMILSCLQGMMGTVLVTDREHPRSALAAAPCFSFYAGEPDRELAAWRPRGEVCMVPPDRRWAALIEERWPRAEKTTRYAIRKDTKFDRKRLTELTARWRISTSSSSRKLSRTALKDSSSRSFSLSVSEYSSLYAMETVTDGLPSPADRIPTMFSSVVVTGI